MRATELKIAHRIWSPDVASDRIERKIVSAEARRFRLKKKLKFSALRVADSREVPPCQ